MDDVGSTRSHPETRIGTMTLQELVRNKAVAWTWAMDWADQGGAGGGPNPCAGRCQRDADIQTPASSVHKEIVPEEHLVAGRLVLGQGYVERSPELRPHPCSRQRACPALCA